MMEVTEMRVLRWMCGHTLMDRIRNKGFRDKLGIAPISGKMRENWLRWFGHVQRKTFAAHVRRVKSIIVEGKRSRKRSRRTWDEQIKVDLHELNLSEGLTRDRGSWRRHIHDYWYPLRLPLSVLVILLLSFLLLLVLFSFVVGSTYLFYLYAFLLFFPCTYVLLFFSSWGTPLVALSFMGMSCRRPSLPKPCP